MPGRTALFVIDPVNDFLSEGGADWDMARSTVEKHEVVGHLKDAIEGERLRRIPVLFGRPMAYTAADYENEELPPERHQPEDVRAAHVGGQRGVTVTHEDLRGVCLLWSAAHLPPEVFAVDGPLPRHQRP